MKIIILVLSVTGLLFLITSCVQKGVIKYKQLENYWLKNDNYTGGYLIKNRQ